MDLIKEICEKHGALLIEDAAESLGTIYKEKQTGTFGQYNAFSFNGNKIIINGVDVVARNRAATDDGNTESFHNVFLTFFTPVQSGPAG